MSLGVGSVCVTVGENVCRSPPDLLGLALSPLGGDPRGRCLPACQPPGLGGARSPLGDLPACIG